MRQWHIAVIGAGTMGSGIAQVFLEHGHSVALIDVIKNQLIRGTQAIERGLGRRVKKGQLTEAQRDEMLAKVTTSVALEDAVRASMDAPTSLIVEAIVEKLPVKQQVFAALDEGAPPETILASNTSSISITELAAATGRPDRVIGMHFMNPAPVMKLVEVIRGIDTSDETCDAVMALARDLGKTPVEVADSPGFALNRLLIPMINEAVYLLQEGVASAEDIDTVMKLGANHPMGPLALADLVGLDTCLAIMNVLHEQLGEDKYRPCPLLRKMVASRHLGRKTGRGFYHYN